MSNLKPSDPLERLLPDARNIVDERAKMLEAPSYTLRADCRFDILAMMTIVSLAEAGEAPAGNLAELKAKLREFEVYEEKYLRHQLR